MSIEYQAPTDLIGAYDYSDNGIALSWTASVDGIPLLFTSNGTYAVDSTAYRVLVQMLAGGGSGGAEDSAGGWGGGGGGGGYASATYSISALPSTVAVTVGAGGAAVGPAASTILAGNAGGNSVFAGYLQANGGAGMSAFSLQGAGGTATLLSSVGIVGSATLETGGEGGVGGGSPPTSPTAGGSTTNAGPGGGSGGRNDGNSPGPGQAGTPGGSCANGGVGGAGGAADPTVAGNGLSGTSFVYAGQKIAGGGGGGGGGGTDRVGLVGGSAGNGGGYGAGGGTGGACGNGTGVNGMGGAGGPGAVFTLTSWLHTHDPYYLVYRGGVLIGVTAEGATTFSDSSPDAGVNVYTVIASYDGVTPMSAASAPVDVTVASFVVNLSGRFVPALVFKASELSNLAGLRPRIWRPNSNNNIRAK